MAVFHSNIFILVIINIHNSILCFRIDDYPIDQDMKAAYKSGEAHEPPTPITIEKIKSRLRESGIFDVDTVQLNDREKKELRKLFDAVEIMTSSRARQPQSVQNSFSSLRLVERVVKKQLKEGQISESLAGKFKWEKLSNRQKREQPPYVLDETKTMRISINESKCLNGLI